MGRYTSTHKSIPLQIHTTELGRCIHLTLKLEHAYYIHGAYKPFAFADGYMATANLWDMQVYSFGKGPTSTAVSIQNDVITNGNTALVKGTVMDISAGTSSSGV